MSTFVFDKEIFKEKFLQGKELRNRAKSTAKNCDNVCPIGSDKATQFNGITEIDIITGVLHSLLGERVNGKRVLNADEELAAEIVNQVKISSDTLKEVFQDIVQEFYSDKSKIEKSSDLSILRYGDVRKKDDVVRKSGIGKFIHDVLLDESTSQKMKMALNRITNPFDDIVNKAYSNLNILQSDNDEKEYTRLFENELKGLFDVMNKDIQAVLDISEGVTEELIFLISYYSFIYLSQLVLKLDNDIENKNKSSFLFFKMGKEPISEDRDCIVLGWRKVEKKTKKIFAHLVLLNMLNAHDNTTPYLTYSDLYQLYEKNPNLRPELEESIEFLIEEYTETHEYEARDGEKIDFTSIEKRQGETGTVDNYKNKILYLFECIEFQLQGSTSRNTVRRNVWCNYERLLKMRFVKSWGNQGNMLMLSNDDLLLMIRVCQRTAHSVDKELGIQISDLFKEFETRGLYFDGQSKKYIIKHLHEINLIDSKSDSEEAQYVKRIQ